MWEIFYQRREGNEKLNLKNKTHNNHNKSKNPNDFTTLFSNKSNRNENW